MKNQFVLMVLSICLLLVSCNNKTQTDSQTVGDENTEQTTESNVEAAAGKVFNVKSGYAKFTTSMDLTRELWWDDYGNKQYEENYMEIMGYKSGTNILTVDGFKYDWDPESKQGSKSKSYMAPATDYSIMEDADIKKYGVKFEGKEKIAGKECEVISIQEPLKSKTWMWQGIPLKSQTPFGKADMVMEAVEVREESVDASKFEIPKDVKFKEAKM
jgi:hypothetical protein